MPGGPSPYRLRHTIAARWRAADMGSQAEPRQHWLTKVAYYRAVVEVLSTAQKRSVNWRAVVAAVRPYGSSSTFYEVAGPRAKQPLMGAYRRAGDADALQIAYTYQRTSAADHLIDEAKVWSFWDYRDAYLRMHDAAEELPAEAYLQALRAWASVNRGLAGALEFAPPACAVEDFVALNGGTLAALRAHQFLTEVMREAVSRPDGSAMEAKAGHDDEYGDLAARIHANELGTVRTSPRPGVANRPEPRPVDDVVAAPGRPQPLLA